MRCFHCWTGFDVVEDALFVNEVDPNEVVDVPFSAFFAGVAIVMEKLSEVNIFGGMLHFEVVLVEPEFACADIEVIDGCTGDVRVVWVLHLWVSPFSVSYRMFGLYSSNIRPSVSS